MSKNYDTGLGLGLGLGSGIMNEEEDYLHKNILHLNKTKQKTQRIVNKLKTEIEAKGIPIDLF